MLISARLVILHLRDLLASTGVVRNSCDAGGQESIFRGCRIVKESYIDCCRTQVCHCRCHDIAHPVDTKDKSFKVDSAFRNSVS